MNLVYSPDVAVQHPARPNWPALENKIHRVTKGIAVLRQQSDTVEVARPIRDAFDR